MEWWYWLIFVLGGIAAIYFARDLEKKIANSPTPFKDEYLATYPDRVINGVIQCGCGSGDLTCKVAPVNVGPVYNVCKACNTTIYTTNVSDRNPHQTEAV